MTVVDTIEELRAELRDCLFAPAERKAHIRREVSDRVAEIIQTIRSRIDLRGKARSVAREWDVGR